MLPKYFYGRDSLFGVKIERLQPTYGIPRRNQRCADEQGNFKATCALYITTMMIRSHEGTTQREGFARFVTTLMSKRKIPRNALA